MAFGAMKDLSVAENEVYIKHQMELSQLPPMDLRLAQPHEVEERCVKFLEICVENGQKPSIVSMALALNCARNTLVDYIKGNKAIPNDNRTVLVKYYSILNGITEAYIQDNKINPVVANFLLKNNYGYKDTDTDIEIDNKIQQESIENLIAESNLLLGEIETIKPTEIQNNNSALLVDDKGEEE